ncbi:MAG: hypothetical protein MSC30_13980 [Gaiellaceae bacterium MAG52_C11]|nr:hypothetical protein [Candidatus Gaiellasilicea maunaloa]
MFDESTLDERIAADRGELDDSSQTAYETPQTRRVVLGRAAMGLAAVGGAASLAGRATAASSQDTAAQVLAFIITQEQFGVTFLTNAVRRAPGTPSAQFLPVLKAANTTEFDHVRGLQRFGARPITSRFWIPDAAFGGGGAGLFASIEAVEERSRGGSTTTRAARSRTGPVPGRSCPRPPEPDASREAPARSRASRRKGFRVAPIAAALRSR